MRASCLNSEINLTTEMKYFVTTLLFAVSISSFAQRNEIFSPRIASLQVVAGNDWLSPPITELNQNPINISFDDLTHEYHRYVYTLQHCEADWSISDDLFENDYMEGFYEGNTIDDMEESVNTNILYTHYQLTIPNERCRIKMSGNYKLSVYDENNDMESVLAAYFMIVDSQMGVSLGVTANTDADIRGRHQQVEMELSYGNVSVNRPESQLKIVVMQNGRWDNAIVNPKAQYTMHDGLRWQHCRDLIFNGGNEYHRFETLDVGHTTVGLEDIRWDGENYHAFVWPDTPRPSYVYEEDANGAFYIRNSDNYENNTTCDYLWVHFELNAPKQVGDVYLNGAWTNDQFLPQYLMEYDEESGCYRANVMLKQGYYSYQYLLLQPDGTTVPVSSEGNFYQTENRYQALVYYKGYGDRADRLVGYTQIQMK